MARRQSPRSHDACSTWNIPPSGNLEAKDQPSVPPQKQIQMPNQHQTQSQQPQPGSSLRLMTAADIPTVITIGRRIWQEHYVPIIGQAQVDYMTGMRFTPEVLSRYLADAPENQPDATRWLWLLELEGQPVGYASCSIGDRPGEMKLEQLYLLPDFHGEGLGGMMLKHIERHTLDLGLNMLWLTVNKDNSSSIRVYRKKGFTVRASAIFDIGNGFVMDDYVMEKKLT